MKGAKFSETIQHILACIATLNMGGDAGGGSERERGKEREKERGKGRKE